jgi:predicted metal-dependent peptidase
LDQLPSDDELQKMFEQIAKEVFMNTNAAFLGSIMCSLDFKWDRGAMIDIVGTNGRTLWWGVRDFLFICKNKKQRISTLLHELWHPARLHHLRRGNRCPDVWNVACDYRINNDLRADGCEIPDDWVVDPSIDDNGIMAEEDIYDMLMKNALQMPLKMPSDLIIDGDTDPNVQAQLLASVVRGLQASKQAGQAGNLPGNLKDVISSFLEPKIPWRNKLYRWMNDLLEDTTYSWRRPNRRFRHVYLPSADYEEGRLNHMAFIEDVSGSIGQADSIRFNSEVKYIWETLKPKKLTLVQFDTKIQQVRVFNEGDEFDRVEIEGRGGTSLACVRAWLEENKPEAAVIFSDMECDGMQPLTIDIPIIWGVIRHTITHVPFGEIIHVED